MSDEANIKTCGREPTCDLVLENETLSRVHARLELGDDGLVSVTDNGSSNGIFVNRNDSWVRARKLTLCIGDRIRFGDLEVPLDRLTAVFGKHATTRLEARRFPVRAGKSVSRPMAGKQGLEATLQKPRRNPVTGKIEEQQTVNIKT